MDNDNKKKKKRSLHPFDIWPPPRKNKDQKPLEKLSEKKPRNAGFIESAYPAEGELIVYDAETGESEREDTEKDKDEEEKEEK